MFDGKVALITGTSSGIGLRTSIAMAKAGFRVVATIRNVSKKRVLLDAAREAGVELDVERLDVTDGASISSCRDIVERRYGRLDVLVNNAGYGLAGALEDVSVDQLRAQLETNLIGATEVTKAFLPMMRRQGSGRIIQISSAGGRTSFPLFGAYHASKWGLEGLSEAWSYELAPQGISMSIVEPGGHRTEFDKSSLVRSTPEASPYREMVAALDERQARFGHLMGPADKVSRTIVRAATARRPRLRYRVGADATAVLGLRALLPTRLFQWSVARALGMPRRIPVAAAVLATLVVALLSAPEMARAEVDSSLPAEPPALVVAPEDSARLERGEVVLHARTGEGRERWAEATYLFDATPPELFEIVSHPETLARIFDEIAVYETLDVHDDGRSVHGIARMGWPLPEFEYWMRTRTDPQHLWNAWKQTRGDFEANDGYWRFAWDPRLGKTVGTMAMHLRLSGALGLVPDDLLVRLQTGRLPVSMHAVETEVKRVRAEEPAVAARLQSSWRPVSDVSASRGETTTAAPRPL